jgi:hypothetical protein
MRVAASSPLGRSSLEAMENVRIETGAAKRPHAVGTDVLISPCDINAPPGVKGE